MEEQKVTFNVVVEGHSGGLHNLQITGLLGKSGAFQYGNGTGVELRIAVEGKHSTTDYLDTRYETGITANFKNWLEQYIRDNWNVKSISEA